MRRRGAADEWQSTAGDRDTRPAGNRAHEPRDDKEVRAERDETMGASRRRMHKDGAKAVGADACATSNTVRRTGKLERPHDVAEKAARQEAEASCLGTGAGGKEKDEDKF